MRKLAPLIVAYMAMVAAFALTEAFAQMQPNRPIAGEEIRIRTEVEPETGVKFSLQRKFSRRSHREIDPCRAEFLMKISVLGEVSETIDLSNDSIARKIIDKGKAYAFSQCKNTRADIVVNLYQAPLDVGNLDEIWVVRAEFRSIRKYEFFSGDYVNRASIAEQQKKYKEEEKRRAEKARVQREAQEAARIAREKEAAIRTEAELKAQQEREEMRKREAHRRRDEFVKKNGVHEWPSLGKLSVNPFVYEGKTIALAAQFDTMLTATDGLFAWYGNYFIISDVPKGLLTSSGIYIVVAGIVVGETEAKQVPWWAEKSVPHLRFVGIHICQYRDCADILGK